MTAVVDSNIVAALVLPTPYTEQALGLMALWDKFDEHLVAPLLFEYEITTIIRRSAALGQIEKAQVPDVLARLLISRVTTIVPTQNDHKQALYWAERLGQHKAYDAQYLALAARENAPLWTADRRLANAAQGAGLDWVHWIGEWKDN
jgi:predicted nucleic acid-binding protein